MLYKDYKFLKGVCERICYNDDVMEFGGMKMGRFDRLMDFDPFVEYQGVDQNERYKQYIKDVLELKGEIIYEFEHGGTYHKPDSVEEPIDSVSDTLVSKILLAALGCVPAYDSYVRKAMADLGVVSRGVTGDSLGKLFGFVTDYKECVGGRIIGLEEMAARHEAVDAGKRSAYPVMKYVDMALWCHGYSMDGKVSDADVE